MPSLINSLAGSSILASSGNSSSSVFTPVQLDLSVLATGSFNTFDIIDIAPKAFTAKLVETPFQTAATEESLQSRADSALGVSRFINTSDPAVARAGSNPDLKATFALYQGLRNLQALAAYAGDDKSPQSKLTALAAKFDAGLAEIRNYIGTAKTDQLGLLTGEKVTSLQSVVVPTSSPSLANTAVQKGERLEAVPGLNGDEVFTLDLKKTDPKSTTAPAALTIDLSELDGPPNLNNIVRLINKKIESVVGTDGKPLYFSRAEVFTDKNGDFGLRFSGTSSERIAISAPDVEPSVYVLGQTSKSGAVSTGQIVRFDTPADSPTVGATAKVATIDAEATALAQKVFETQTQTEPRAKGAPEPVAPGNIDAETQARAIATDSQGFVYTVGRASGDQGAFQNPNENDIVLNKYTSDGTLVYSRYVGVSDKADGYAIAVDKDDNVIIAGTTTAKLDSRDVFSGQDSFVSKYSSDGAEIFTVQLDGIGVDTPSALATDANGDIYVAGSVSLGSVRSGLSTVGGQDIYVARIDGGARTVEGLTSRIEQVVQLGTTGSDSVGALAFDTSGRLLVGGTEDGRAIVRSLDAADLAATGDRIDLGALGGGALTGLAVDSDTGAIVVAGSTRAGGLGGAAAQTGSFSGDTDGFVARLDPGLNVDGVTYLGGTGAEKLAGIAVRDGKIYVAGQSNSGFLAGQKGKVDSFLARIDEASGAVESVTSNGSEGDSFEVRGLAVGEATSGTLKKLGLRAGVYNPTQNTDLLAATSLREGDHFYISVNGGARRKITIEAGETLDRLARKLTQVSGRALTATASFAIGGRQLSLRQSGDNEVAIIAGDAGSDALGKLGIEAASLIPTKRLFDISESTDNKSGVTAQTPGGFFALNLAQPLALTDKKAAKYVATQIDSAIEQVQRAYRSLYYDATKARLERAQASQGAVPEFLTKQIASYQDALFRLTGSTGTTSGGLF
ncbi:MAG: hypothetical protein E6R12_07370 [Sphingomonadales bacterium]|nr:MAG: hypothetical protein E6R12_07370 [Sphingomonadales bacterium]